MEEEYGSILISIDLKDFLHGCIGLGMVSLGYEVFLVMGFVDPYSFLWDVAGYAIPGVNCSVQGGFLEL